MLVRLVMVVSAVLVAVLMQEQALRILEDEDLQPELIADGVEIAMFVVYVLQNEEARAKSELNDLRHLSLLQLAVASRTSNEIMQRMTSRTLER